MALFDFVAQPPASRDRIWVSWNEQWDLSSYADDYLRSRNLRADEKAREHIRRRIAELKVEGALRKADVDYFLDANVRPELELQEGTGVYRGKRA